MQFSIRAKGRSSSRHHICGGMVAQRCSESHKVHRNQIAKRDKSCQYFSNKELSLDVSNCFPVATGS